MMPSTSSVKLRRLLSLLMMMMGWTWTLWTTSSHSEPQLSAKADDILESSADAAEWNLEVEQVLKQLKVTTRSDKTQWRLYLDQMLQPNKTIKSPMTELLGQAAGGPQ